MCWLYWYTEGHGFYANVSDWCVSFWMEKRKYCSYSEKPTIKTLERLIFNKIFIFFSANKLISKSHSSFHSYIKQMLSVTHEIFTSFSIELKRRSFFLDISKGFDKNWHEGLNFKLKQNSISCELPLIFKQQETKGCI